MKGNKIIATLVVMTMLLSTLVVLNNLNINVVGQASATPGVNAWGNATTELIYNQQYATDTIKINTRNWTLGTYYLYYPTFVETGAGVTASNFTWDGPFKVNVPVKLVATGANDTLNTAGSPITFNRSGMWIFDTTTEPAIHYGDNLSSFGGYLWVNTSTDYSISSIPDFTFGSTSSTTITVDTGTDTGCQITIVGPQNKSIYNGYRNTGTVTLGNSNFTWAGDYTVYAYRDLDGTNIYTYMDEGEDYGYNESYGSGYHGFPDLSTVGDHYYYPNVGPWDPPERNATPSTFTVTAGKPKIVLTNTTLYWGFDAHIDINVTDDEGNGLDDLNAIKLKFGSKYIDMTKFPHVTDHTKGNYSIDFERYDVNPASWHDLALALNNTGNNTNGTWRIVFGYDINGDHTDEWNDSATFMVKNANPPVRLVLVNYTKNKIEWIPAYQSGNITPTIEIQFDIFGRNLTGDRAYYGDQPNSPQNETSDNINVEGDILYPANLTHMTKGRWKAKVTPTKPGGTINITIDWPGDDNGTATQILEIVNGTHITAAAEKFTYGFDYNLTVTVTDLDGDNLKYAYIRLMWSDSAKLLNETNGTNKAGNGANGQYTFWITADDQLKTPPENITIAAEAYWGSTYWGYTKVIMEKNHNMMVNITPTTSYAGDATEYDITVDLVGGGHAVDSGLHIRIYNSTGDPIADDSIDWWSSDNHHSLTNEIIPLSGGTFYFYAYNNTHDSQGNNATVVITKYTVTSSPSTLAWLIDTAVNMTFQVTPAGNGTLTLYNMSGVPEASIEGESDQVAIVNGIGVLAEVNATTLGNVTFNYYPDEGADRPANGLLRVTTATATPNPATIYIHEETDVTITITHPATGTPLEDIRVGLDYNKSLNQTILAKLPDDQFTDSAGKVIFSILAYASGEITIYIENESDPNNEFVIEAKGREPMTISLNPSVNEGKTFTVEAKSNGVLITSKTVTFTFDGQTWPTTTGVATITAPSVSTSMTYPIEATAEGFVTATGSIMVLNVPKLIIAVSGEVKAGQTFTLTIADDTGSPVIGATLTFEGKTYTSGAGGVVTITAPSKEGNYAVTATFPGYETISSTVTVAKGGGIPGFELLTLIAAIGVAFLLLRRRRN